MLKSKHIGKKNNKRGLMDPDNKKWYRVFIDPFCKEKIEYKNIDGTLYSIISGDFQHFT